MHRQLAGIGEIETRLLYLRKSQRLEDFGVNFFKAFRVRFRFLCFNCLKNLNDQFLGY